MKSINEAEKDYQVKAQFEKNNCIVLINYYFLEFQYY